MSTLLTPPSLRTTQALGLTTSLLLTGSALNFTFAIVPIILLAPPSTLLRQWKLNFDLGKVSQPPLALISSVSYVYVFAKSWYVRDGAWRNDMWGLLVAAALSVGIVPWTVVMMGDVNSRLMEMERGVREMGDGVKEESMRNAHELVDRWGMLNLVSTGMVGLGAAIGAWKGFGDVV
ncbi:hypothetical protein BJ875DRAFT_236026 [Amylocarpus encephaloides]|uniref:DUF1772-domain-containing protein n=1 Tax=Amylocarpus encephaloides TaxID=45428 RepID=A0A9P7YMF6_9HELO|nr:hypothetical protein BJ875DRAFT_236026 [Amylocarpus encephaloides]